MLEAGKSLNTVIKWCVHRHQNTVNVNIRHRKKMKKFHVITAWSTCDSIAVR